MLTGNLLRVKHARDRIIPYYLDPENDNWHLLAESLLEVFQNKEGHTRGEIDQEIEEAFGSDTGQLVQQGLIKLLEDRCEFEVVSDHAPEELRQAVFRAAAAHRAGLGPPPDALTVVGRPPQFDRQPVLQQVANELGLTPEQVDAGLFADLRSEQKLIRFRPLTARQLLDRYNVALAQAVLLRSTKVRLNVRGETPARYRQLMRQMKFHRLICEIKKTGPDSYQFQLDGPLSLFSATQKYGLQLALFLPTVLLCRDFELRAELRWSAQRKPKYFLLNPDDELVSQAADTGTYVPPEVHMFVELFRKRRPDWEITEETDILPLGDSFWVPDFQLRHKESDRSVFLEILGFWRRSSAESHLHRLRTYVRQPYLLAVSDALKIDEDQLEALPAGLHRFRQMPLPDEIARLAAELLGLPSDAEKKEEKRTKKSS